MKAIQRAATLGVLAFSLVFASPAWLIAQQPALTDEQMENFLRTAKIIGTKGVKTGVTNISQATLSDGTLTHDAAIQTVDIAKSVFSPNKGPTQLNFKDTYRFNIAGYRLARMLGLTKVPVAIERNVRGTSASVMWWVDDVMMDEGARAKRPAPSAWRPERTAGQVYIMRVFDELIANTDRNAGNLLWTTDGTMWMIDHTRAFRYNTKLTNPALLLRIDRHLFVAMRTLTAENLKEKMGSYLGKAEIDAMLARRDELIKLFEAKIAERGEAAILYTAEI